MSNISVNSTHNGIYNGKRYFHVPRGHGAMVKYTEVMPLKQPEKRPAISGNSMFPSWHEVQRRRKERNQKYSFIETFFKITMNITFWRF